MLTHKFKKTLLTALVNARDHLHMPCILINNVFSEADVSVLKRIFINRELCFLIYFVEPQTNK